MLHGKGPCQPRRAVRRFPRRFDQDGARPAAGVVKRHAALPWAQVHQGRGQRLPQGSLAVPGPVAPPGQRVAGCVQKDFDGVGVNGYQHREGRPVPVERYNGKPCYKVSFKEEMDAGLFRERFDRLCRLVPLTEIGTVHADNFLACYNEAPEVDISEMQDARDRMIDYVRGLGIDVTSEFPYREGPSGRDSYSHSCMRAPTYPIRCLGRISAQRIIESL